MLPDIGLMVGVYIITRMISFLSRKQERAEPIVVKVFAVITIAISVIVILDLLLRGTGPSQFPR